MKKDSSNKNNAEVGKKRTSDSLNEGLPIKMVKKKF